jgi:hypothetical protein
VRQKGCPVSYQRGRNDINVDRLVRREPCSPSTHTSDSHNSQFNYPAMTTTLTPEQYSELSTTDKLTLLNEHLDTTLTAATSTDPATSIQ